MVIFVMLKLYILLYHKEILSIYWMTLVYAFFLTFFLILKPVLVFNPKKFRERLTFAIMLRFLTSCQHVFRLWFHLLYVTSPQKQVTDVSLVLKDSDMDSENLSLLIRFSVSDGQKTDSSKVVSVIGI